MTNVADRLRELLQQQRNMGGNPAELHMCRITLEKFVAENNIVPDTEPDSRSVMEAFLRGPRKEARQVLRFEKLPLVANDELPLDLILARPAMTLHDPNWFRRLQAVRVFR